MGGSGGCFRLRIEVFASILILVAGPFTGCRKEPWSAQSNLELTLEEQRLDPALSPSEQAKALAAMRSVAEAAEASGRWEPDTKAITRGIRFDDVEHAARAAADEVEMGVIRVEYVPRRDPVLVRVKLITIEEWPGELIVERVPGPEVYAAQVAIGRFPNEPDRTRRANELLRAFDRLMRKYGEKRAIAD